MSFRPTQHPEELISASLTGDLSGAERATLESHLAECEQCRTTLAAFGEQRRLISQLREVAPPRDMAATVHSQLESGRAAAWWRRPAPLVAAVATLATVAAALLAVVVLSDLVPGPVGATDTPSPQPEPSMLASLEPSAVPEPNVTATPAQPQPEPAVALQPGELGYLAVEGEAFSPSRLFFINDASGESLEAETPSGPPIAAAISPTAEWLAYITEVGEAGANQVWLLHLVDGTSQVLGCGAPHPFAERLVWSDDGRFLAYTLAALDLGGSIDCGGVEGDGTQTDAWIFDAAATGESARLTDTGDAFAGDFLRYLDVEGGYTLLVSHAAEQPYTESVRIPSPLEPDDEPQRIDGVFLPLISPNGDRALFWRGQMQQGDDGAWRFIRGGMPYVSGEPVESRPSWSGEPLFADLAPRGGDGFESGRVAWGDDSDLVAFWNGAWTGPPQDADGSYPSSRDVYVGRLTEGLLGREARLPLDLEETERIISVALGPDGVSATVTIAQASAGVGEPRVADLFHVPFTGDPSRVGPDNGEKPWSGPSVYGEEPVELPH